MQKLFIVGNLTRDPELRTTQSGISVCSFTVAVNRRRQQNGQQEADYFRVSAWREQGENCNKYLAKGRKVAVTGTVSVSTYQGNNGQTYASLDVTAEDVEFLTPREQGAKDGVQAPQRPTQQPSAQQMKIDAKSGFQQVEEDELPF